MNRAILAFTVFLILGGPAYAEPIRLDVGGIDVEDRTVPPQEAEHHGPPPASALEHWVHERLAATGNGPPAHFAILEATVTLERLPTEHGMGGWFKDQQDRKLTAYLKARLEFATPRHSASATAEATASTTVAESATPADLDAAYAKVLDIAAAEFDKRMTQEVHTQFGDLVAP